MPGAARWASRRVQRESWDDGEGGEGPTRRVPGTAGGLVWQGVGRQVGCRMGEELGRQRRRGREFYGLEVGAGEGWAADADAEGCGIYGRQAVGRKKEGELHGQRRKNRRDRNQIPAVAQIDP